MVPDEDLSAVIKALELHKSKTLEEPGCNHFQVTQCSNNDNRFNVYEEFVDRAAFDFHQQRVKNSEWGKVSCNVQRFYQLTELDD